MSNETKRDVFVNLAEDVKINDSFDEEYPKSREDIEKEYKENIHNYDAALPDDLPVIPEVVGKYLKMWKHDYGDLFQAFDEGTSTSLDGTKWKSVQDWFIDTQDRFDIFARAWVLGAWKVDETGEIVKLEAEK